MTIPEAAAIEAGAKVLEHESFSSVPWDFPAVAKRVLEAAEPHMCPTSDKIALICVRDELDGMLAGAKGSWRTRASRLRRFIELRLGAIEPAQPYSALEVTEVTDEIRESLSKVATLWSTALDTGEIFHTTVELRDALSRLSGWVNDALAAQGGKSDATDS